MFIPQKLLKIELERHGCCWKLFLDYRTMREKVLMHNLRLKYLESCRSAEIIPRFLTFRILNNGCFDNKSVHDF